MNTLQPIQFRDMRRGVIRKSAVGNVLIPTNSVSHSMNVNFDKKIGSAVVRSGTVRFGTTVTVGVTPLGLAEFGTTVCAGVAVFSGAANATIYYLNSSNVLKTSSVTNLDNTHKVRFTVLGDRIFRANGVDAMSCSADGNTWATTNCLTTVIPGILLASKNVMLASGYSKYPSRVYFSSVIDPTSSPFITWDEHGTTGDWIDVNPDDGDSNTGFAETSTLTLVFKNRAIYRLDSISKTVDTKNLINVGAPSQEAIVRCPYDGKIYFFTGQDIRRTDGGFPEQISRLGVQDFIDAIPYASWSNIAAGTDGFNVLFSIGDITLNTGKDEQESFKNVVLKFSPRDESWSVHSYAQEHRLYSQMTVSGRVLIEADTSPMLQKMDTGTTDNSTPIFYDLRTQEDEMGNRAHVKTISDDITVFADGGRFGIQSDGGEFEYSAGNLLGITKVPVNATGHYFTYRWTGESSGTPPTFEGYYIENITDSGTQ